MASYRIWIAPEGKLSEDGRGFDPGSLEFRSGALPLLWRPSNDDGHDGAIVVGAFTNTERRDRDGVSWLVSDSLVWDSSPLGSEARRMVDDGIMASVSADWSVESYRYEATGESAGEWVEKGMLLGAALVPLQAFSGAEIEVTDMTSDDTSEEPLGLDELVAAAMATLGTSGTAVITGSADLAVADRDATWDGAGATTRIFDRYTNADGEVDVAAVSRAFIIRRDDADPQTQAAYSLGFADIVDDELVIIPAGIAATAGGRGLSAVEGLGAEERSAAESRICSIYDTVRDKFEDWPECPFDGGEASVQAHGMEAADYELPPAEWFATPEPDPDDPSVVWVDEDGRTVPAGTSGSRAWGVPLTITAEGRVYGHLASWQDCHTAFADRCVPPPMSASGYAWFHTGETLTADGPVPTGRITVDTKHADRHASAAAAVGHYDHTGHAVADVTAVDGELGPWLSGWVRPWATARQRHELVAHPPSGDWRPRGGSTELLGVLSVNVPGFPLPRTVATFRKGELASLIASGLAPISVPDDQTGILTQRLERIEARLDAEAVLRTLEMV